MRVKVAEVGGGLHPSEIVVAVKTIDRTENIVVDRRSLKDGTVEIGYPIRKEGDLYLVELPRETMSGSRRVWVKSDQTSEEEERIRA